MATLRYMDFQSQIKGKLFQILQGHRNVQSPGGGDFSEQRFSGKLV